MSKTLRYLAWIAGGIFFLVLLALVLRLLFFMLMPVVAITPPPPAKADLSSTEQASVVLHGQMWRFERIIDLLTLLMAVGTIVVGFGALVGYSVVRDLLVAQTMAVAERYAKGYTEQYFERSHNESIVHSMGEESYIHWRISTMSPDRKPIDLSDAIRRAEGALQRADRFNPDEIEMHAQLKMNLAYYYAQADKREKKNLALEYAKWAREQMYKVSFLPPTVLIANDIYVRMHYSNQRADLEAVRNELVEQLEIYASDLDFCDELRGYLQELDQKIKGLSTGP